MWIKRDTMHGQKNRGDGKKRSEKVTNTHVGPHWNNIMTAFNTKVIIIIQFNCLRWIHSNQKMGNFMLLLFFSCSFCCGLFLFRAECWCCRVAQNDLYAFRRQPIVQQWFRFLLFDAEMGFFKKSFSLMGNLIECRSFYTFTIANK